MAFGSASRRRSQRACESCYRKKTKCEVEGSGMVCVQCARRGIKCTFSGPENGDDTKSDEYVRSLKDRLERVESLLKTAGILHEDEMTTDDLSDDEVEGLDERWDARHQRPESSDMSSNRSSTTQESWGHDIENYAGGGDIEAASIFRQHEQDDSRYFGRSCSLSILSRGGIEWIKSKTGDVSFLSILSPDSIHDSPWSQWRPDVFHDLFASQVFKPLPPRSEVFSLMKDFFQTANRLFPIYHEASFMRMVEWQYTQQTCDDAARWASINMIICLAYEYRISNSAKTEKDREKSRFYFKNAMSVFTDLALRRTDLLSVQALLSMAFFLRGNSGTQFSLPLITAAMRSCQRMGLHRNIPRPDLSPAQQEQRRRVFWVAFFIDQSTCLRAGNAPSQHPDDFDVPLPEEIEDDRKPGSPSNIPFFRQLCRMSVIKSRIFCRLYSAKAMLKPPHEIYQTVKELHAELENWEKDYPLDDEPKFKVDETEFLFGFASIGLHFVYYNAQIMIHRIPLLLHFLISSRDETPELKSISITQASKSGAICVQAARDTLKMVNNMPWGDIAWIWSLLYYVFLAAATIFSNIIRDTRNPKVREDLATLNMAATFFATLVPGDGPTNYAGFMTHMSANLERIARSVVDKDEKRIRESGGADREHQPSGAKRQSSRTTSGSHSKPHHRPTTLRVSMTPDILGSSGHSMATARPIPHPSTTRSQMPDLSIPEALEGLPPVNSSGYVVPLSPSANAYTPMPQQPTTTNNYVTGLGLDLNGASASDMGLPSWQLAQDHSATTSSPLDNVRSPYSQDSSTSTVTGNMIPESWQVPLTADWEFGDNLWSGLFPSESIAASARAPDMYFPILSAESFLSMPPGTEPDAEIERNFATAGAGNPYNFTAGQDPNQDPSQAESSWPNGFLGLF
ncbi:uncharacterized protein N7498_003982 [Penicillium cinerascens]|uniref:Zn(2)-C6 fungal-type domain-containing protein n=1 Tax=Penicillium cinerascens TaxID=70096 RepID=A0A9W9N341_9EURO|nr:uncharacterized protein N7498_003982 [Penicillium cinerascens]KAJ5212336.1 hypothetical protein N7498_003982 [Penicillium cinerascens]